MSRTSSPPSVGDWAMARVSIGVFSLGEAVAFGGGTAIGDAMRVARQQLYRSGVFRKYLIVVTDGENSAGQDPAHVAREIHRRSEGSVVMYFVAFDTSATKFSFLADVGGAVVEARNGSDLEAKLAEIYEGRILAEAVDYGETHPPQKSR